MYFKKNSGAYVSVPGVFVSGNKFNSTWTFTTDASLVGGLISGDVVSYYFVSQDEQIPDVNTGGIPAMVYADDVNDVY